jgi:hypothetical protein
MLRRSHIGSTSSARIGRSGLAFAFGEHHLRPDAEVVDLGGHAGDERGEQPAAQLNGLPIARRLILETLVVGPLPSPPIASRRSTVQRQHEDANEPLLGSEIAAAFCAVLRSVVGTLGLHQKDPTGKFAVPDRA